MVKKYKYFPNSLHIELFISVSSTIEKHNVKRQSNSTFLSFYDNHVSVYFNKQARAALQGQVYILICIFSIFLLYFSQWQLHLASEFDLPARIRSNT